MSIVITQTLDGVTTDVTKDYLTPEEATALIEGETLPDEVMPNLALDALMQKISDIQASNEGFDEKDALIYALDKEMISDEDYDTLYPIVMGDSPKEW